LLLVLIVGIAYLATHVAFDWLARRFHLVSGAEYLVLGILLGPQVSGLLTAEVLDSFAPLITLSVGWIGAGVGLRLKVPTLVSIPGLHYRLAFGQALATLAVVTVAELYALQWLFDLPFKTALVPALALGAIAVSSTPFAADIVARSLKRDAPIFRLLETSALVDALVAILAIGILLCIERPFLAGHGRAYTPTEWVMITFGIGVIGGALFHLFLGGERHVDRLFVGLAGSLILASGAAAYLGLSPLLTAMIVGAMLVNTSRSREQIERVISHGQRPFYFVLLVFAGALWHPGATSWLPVLLFLGVRAMSKVGGARLSARMAHVLPLVGRGWGWALFGQGGLALAIALDYLRHDAALFPDLVFTTAVVSVLLTDVLSARFARAVVAPVLDQVQPDQLRVPPGGLIAERS
jgi:Kef-type K+ transport system membrane component KefB